MSWFRYLKHLRRALQPTEVKTFGDRRAMFPKARLDVELLEKRWLMTAGITEYLLPTTGSSPVAIAKGSDGNLWVLESGADKIAKVTTTGTITEYALSGTGTGLSDITAGPDGNLWFTETSVDKVGTITTSGTITEYTLAAGSKPKGIASGPDGNLWVTESGKGTIAKITPSGSTTTYLITGTTDVEGIAAGPDGRLWFTEADANAVAKITTSGSYTVYSLATGSSPISITAGSDGNMWFLEPGTNKVARITLGGTVTEYAVPSVGSGLRKIAQGPDGNVYFSEKNAVKLGSLDIYGNLVEYVTPSGPTGITSGPDGFVWFTEDAVGKVAKLTDLAASIFRSVDPIQSTFVTLAGNIQITPQTGAFRLDHVLDDAANPGQGGGLGIHYDSASIAGKPIVEVTYASDPGGSVPTQIQAQLTWNGVAQTTQTFSTTGHSVGDVYLMDLQPGSSVSSSSVYPYSVTVTATFTGGTTITRTVNGKSLVVANPSSGPLGAGWSLDGVDRLVAVGNDFQWVYGSGGSRYFRSLGGTSYLSPANDFGSLVKATAGGVTTYTYTAKDQTQYTFNGSGYLLTVTDPHNLTRTFTYNGSNQLTQISEPDGGTAVFTYTSGLLTKVTETGNRVVTLSYTGGNLTSIQDPDGTSESFSYDGSGRLQNDQHGPLSATFTYDATNGNLSSVAQGLGATMTVNPASTQGLNSTAQLASKAVGVMTDGLSHPATYVLDSAGRATKVTLADGSVQSYKLDFAGQTNAATDPLNHVTTNLYDYNTGKGDLTQVTNADGSIATYAYDSTFHHQTLSVDPNGNRTTSTYDTTTGDLLTTKDALGNVTSYAYYQSGGRSNGLVQSITDPLNHITSYAYDSNRRVTQMFSAFGATEQTQTTYIYDSAGNLLSKTSGIASSNQLLSTTSFAYDSMRRMTQTFEAFGTTIQRTTTNVYDAVGDLLSTTDGKGNITSYAYDQLGRQNQIISGYGTAVASTATMIYDAAGNLLSQTTGISSTATYDHHTTTSYGYDAANRQNQVITGYGAAEASTTTMVYDATGNLLSETMGISTTSSYDHHTTTSFGYDFMNRQITQITGIGTINGVTATMIYDAAGNLLSQTSGISVTATYDHHTTTSFGYDALNRQIAKIDAYGTSLQRTTTTTFDAAGNTLSTTDPLGHITSFAYNALNQETKVITAYGTSVAVTGTMIYDSQGHVLSQTDNQSTTASYDHSITTSFAYNALNQQTQVISGYGTAAASTTTMIYDLAGNLLSQTSGYSSTATYTHATTTSFAYDALNRRTATLEAFGTTLQRTTSNVYDAAGNILYTTDPLGHVTSFTYNALNQETQSINGYGSPVAVTTTFLYDAIGNLLSQTDSQSTTLSYDHSVTTSYAYNALNQRTQIIKGFGTALAVTSTMLYDAAGNLLSLTSGYSSTSTYTHATTTSFAYDALNRSTATLEAFGTALQRTASNVYDAAGNVVQSLDALGFTTTLVYDALNRVTSVTDPAGDISQTVFDAAGNIVNTIDPNNNKTTSTFDSLNRQTATTDARGGITTSVFDAAGNQVNLIDSVNNKTTFVYDGLNRLTTQTDPLGKSATFAYSATDKLNSTTDRLGRRRDLTYDALDRETMETWVVSGTAVNTLTFGFDAAGEMLTASDKNGAYTMVYDSLGRMTSQQQPFGQALTFTYDAASNRTVRTDSQSGVSTLTYDVLNRMTTYQYGGSGVTPLRLDLSYTARDQLSFESRYSDLAGTTLVGTTSMSYDNAMRETRLQFKDASGSNISNFTYSYDAGNRLTSETLAVGTSASATTSYQYDTANQLTQAGTATYGYDLNGNRTNTGYVTGTENQLTNDGTWTYTYDNEGSLLTKSKGTGAALDLTTYTYDNLNHLVGAQETIGGAFQMQATYAYDVFGNRLETDVMIGSGTTTITRFAYDNQNAWADLNGSNALQMRRLYLNNIDQLFGRIGSGGTAAWYLIDRLGTIRDIANNSSGISLDHLDYDGFGGVITETQASNGDRYKYSSREWDSELSEYYYRARQYGQAMGRFASQDPEGFRAFDANLYRYVSNNPTDAVDPFGLARAKLGFKTAEPFKGPETRPYGAFFWPILWTLDAKHDYGIIVQRIYLNWDINVISPKFNNKPHPMLPSLLRRIGPQTPNDEIIPEWYELWQVRSSNGPSVGTEETSGLSDSAQKLYTADGFTDVGKVKADDFFFMDAGEATKDEWRNDRDKSYGWISITAVARFYEGVLINNPETFKGYGFKQYTNPNKNPTGAGGLWCCPIPKRETEPLGRVKTWFFGGVDGGYTRPEESDNLDVVARRIVVSWDFRKDNGKTNVTYAQSADEVADMHFVAFPPISKYAE